MIINNNIAFKASLNSNKEVETQRLDYLEKYQKSIKEDIKARNLEKEVPERVVKIFKRITQTGAFKSIVKNPKGVGYALAIGNTGKELVGTAMYTVQALTNEDLPPNKRKFIGMYDLGVGAISTSLCFVTGLLAVKYQDGAIVKLLTSFNQKETAKNYKKFAPAFGGLRFLIPLVIQTILIKRIIAPAIATPFAGKMKKKMEAKDAQKLGQMPKDYKIPVENDIVLSSTKIKGHSVSDQNSAQKAENIFSAYKHAVEDHSL